MNQSEQKKEKINQFIFVAVLLFFLLINASRLFNVAISGDEGFSFMLAKMNVTDMLKATGADVHPPLYYLFMMLFGRLTGFSIFGGRLLSYMAIIIAAVGTGTYVKKRFGDRAALISFALLTFTANCMDMVVEIRMYTWSMLFVTITALFAYELLRALEEDTYLGKTQIKKWTGLTVFGLAAGYSHYYALIMAAFIFGSLFFIAIVKNRKNWIPCLLCALAAVVVYFPWLLVLLRQFGMVSDNYWIDSVELKDWIRYIFGDNRFGKLLRIILVITGGIFIFTKEGLWFQRTKRKKAGTAYRVEWESSKLDAKRWLVIICGITTAGTLAVAVLVSLCFRPLYVSRYLYSAMGLVTLAFGISFSHCSRKYRYTWILLLGVLFFGLKSFLPLYETESGYQVKQRKLLTYLESEMHTKDIVLSNDSQIEWTLLQYYFTQNDTHPLGTFNLLEEDYDVAWYLNTQGELDNRIKAFRKKGLQAEEIMEAGLGRYPCILYRITKRETM